MKKLIIIIVIAVAGYFAYQHFYLAPQEDFAMEEETESTVESSTYSQEPLPPVPESCQHLVKKLENALYGNATGQASFSQRNYASRELRSCLRAEGFSGDQIGNTIVAIQT